MENNILLKNCTIIDGTGRDAYLGHICIRNGTICSVNRASHDYDSSDIEKGVKIVDLSGLCVSPGFIDSHGHSDVQLFHDSSVFNKAEQGITTEVTGMCGVTMAPVSSKFFSDLKNYVTPFVGSAKMPSNWETMSKFRDYLNAVRNMRLGINMAFFVGHGTIKIAAMGSNDRVPDRKELSQMCKLTAEALESGAIGVSAGLVYSPGMYSSMDELKEICKVIKEYDGVFAVHMRNESDAIVDAVKEIIEISKSTGVRSVISHHKIGGKNNKGLSSTTLSMVQNAVDDGCQLYMDQYPYVMAASTLSVVIPPKYHTEGHDKLLEKLKNHEERRKIIQSMESKNSQWDSYIQSCGYDGITIVSCDKDKSVQGKTVDVIAKERNCSNADAIIDLLVESDGLAGATFNMTNEDDLINIMQFERTAIGTDGEICTDSGLIHPRLFGTMPRILGLYVREKNALSIEQAVHKMTGLTADIYGLNKKGRIQEGFDADLVVFNRDTIKDHATCLDPTAGNDGIEMVLIGGKEVVKGGSMTLERNGHVLTKK